MRALAKPNVGISKCLGFDNCRWNGAVIPDEFVESLKPHVSYKPVCPELEIGLGVPRDPIRIVDTSEGPRLVQPATGKDVSEKMRRFTETFLSSLVDVDGFILKFRSPSCGMKGVKIYAGPEKGTASILGPGFFGGAVLEKFPGWAIEEEGRLRNFRLREHFLTKLFLMADFRKIQSSGAMRELIQFQAQNKLLLMAYNQKELRNLGRLVANLEKRPVAEILEDYEKHLACALARPPRYLSNINVLMHALGFFSKELSAKEKAFFLDALERYRNEKVPFSVPLNLTRAWVVRFEQEYLGQQTFFDPYPEALLEISDSGKGRKL
ncbi:MAG: cytoplasmic protein [candidate division Zixibacteria bacterium SM23_81]|nr:MAG: cytoplasmic protein [candidate division Zixibacteria bacterium SM23_81]